MHRKICSLMTVIALVILSASCAWGVAIDAANFPDASFRSHVKQYDTGQTEYDSNGEAHWAGNDDGFLDWPEIERVTGMNAFRHSSVKGIEYFTMLDTLGVNGNENYADGPGETFLTEVNISALHHLGLFNCFHNRINALDVSQNPELWSLLCFNNNIKNLDVSHNPKLRILMCDQNPLGQLNVSNNTQLENLRCYRNELKELNVRNNSALSVLYCFDNKIANWTSAIIQKQKNYSATIVLSASLMLRIIRA